MATITEIVKGENRDLLPKYFRSNETTEPHLRLKALIPNPMEFPGTEIVATALQTEGRKL